MFPEINENSVQFYERLLNLYIKRLTSKNTDVFLLIYFAIKIAFQWLYECTTFLLDKKYYCSVFKNEQ